MVDYYTTFVQFPMNFSSLCAVIAYEIIMLVLLLQKPMPVRDFTATLRLYFFLTSLHIRVYDRKKDPSTLVQSYHA